MSIFQLLFTFGECIHLIALKQPISRIFYLGNLSQYKQRSVTKRIIYSINRYGATKYIRVHVNLMIDKILIVRARFQSQIVKNDRCNHAKSERDLLVDNDTRRRNSGGRNYIWVVKKEVDRRVILLCASCMSYQALYRYGLKLGPLLSYSICTQLLSSKKSQLNNQKVLAKHILNGASTSTRECISAAMLHVRLTN